MTTVPSPRIAGLQAPATVPWLWNATAVAAPSKPVASLPPQGACPAGGCLLSLTCDYRVLADNPKYLMGLNETLLGIVAPFW